MAQKGNKDNVPTKDPSLSPLSFGCEFEFLIAYLPSDAKDPHEGQPGLPPLLRNDRRHASDQAQEILEHVRGTLRAHGIPVKEAPPGSSNSGSSESPSSSSGSAETIYVTWTPPNPAASRTKKTKTEVTDPPATESLETKPVVTKPPSSSSRSSDVGSSRSAKERLRSLSLWDVAQDVSVRELSVSGYSWLNVELRSPAFHRSEAALRSVKYVLDLLKSSYRIRVNATTGFHVHVGNGQDFIPPRTLRKLAALLWAADPMISRLHPPGRRGALYSNSIRYGSTLAVGLHGARSAREAVRTEEGLILERDRMVLSTSSLAPSCDTTSTNDQDGGKVRSPDLGLESPKKSPRARSNTSSNSDDGGEFNPPGTMNKPRPIGAMERDENREISGSTLVGDDFKFPGTGGSNERRPIGAIERDSNREVSGSTLFGGGSGTNTPVEPDPKLLPHDISRLTKEYKQKNPANYDRIPWVPALHNPTDPGEPHSKDDPDNCPEGCTAHPVTTTWDGVCEIADCRGKRTTPTVGLLLCGAGTFERLNYNFRNYSPLWMSILDSMRTIEFREAIGTVDGNWATVWVSICVGLVDYCRRSSVTEFLDVLRRVASQVDRDQRGLAQMDAERYDVCDFLDDIGLFREAEFVRRRERKSGPPL